MLHSLCCACTIVHFWRNTKEKTKNIRRYRTWHEEHDACCDFFSWFCYCCASLCVQATLYWRYSELFFVTFYKTKNMHFYFYCCRRDVYEFLCFCYLSIFLYVSVCLCVSFLFFFFSFVLLLSMFFFVSMANLKWQWQNKQ